MKSLLLAFTNKRSSAPVGITSYQRNRIGHAAPDLWGLALRQ